MSSPKCKQCGLVNFNHVTECKRCQNPLGNDISPQSQNFQLPRTGNQNGLGIYQEHVTSGNSSTEAESGKSNHILPAAGVLTLLFALSFFVKTMIFTKKVDLAARRDNAVAAQTVSDSGFNNQGVGSSNQATINSGNQRVISNGYQETTNPAATIKIAPMPSVTPMLAPDAAYKSTVEPAYISNESPKIQSVPTPKPQGVYQMYSAPDRSSNTGQTSSATQIPTPMTISGGVLNGKATNLVRPQYSAAAKAVRAAGTVNVEVTIDVDGNVVSANAVSGHPLLKTSAELAARSSKFNPTILSGQKVKVVGVIVYNFTAQ